MSILDTLQQKDRRAFCWVQQYRTHALHAQLLNASLAMSRTADGPLYVILPLLYWAVSDSDGLLFCKTLVLAFAFERSLHYVMKNTCKRNRPCMAMPGFDSALPVREKFSFPSGHTSGAFLFVTLCSVLLSPWFALLYGWAACVGLSRVVLGVHFPVDVLVGALTGMLMGLAVAFVPIVIAG